MPYECGVNLDRLNLQNLVYLANHLTLGRFELFLILFTFIRWLFRFFYFFFSTFFLFFFILVKKLCGGGDGNGNSNAQPAKTHTRHIQRSKHLTSFFSSLYLHSTIHYLHTHPLSGVRARLVVFRLGIVNLFNCLYFVMLCDDQSHY